MRVRLGLRRGPRVLPEEGPRARPGMRERRQGGVGLLRQAPAPVRRLPRGSGVHGPGSAVRQLGLRGRVPAQPPLHERELRQVLRQVQPHAEGRHARRRPPTLAPTSSPTGQLPLCDMAKAPWERPRCVEPLPPLQQLHAALGAGPVHAALVGAPAARREACPPVQVRTAGGRGAADLGGGQMDRTRS